MRFKEYGTMVNAVKIPVDKLIPDPDQPRKKFDPFELEELGNSLLLGQIHPLLVRVVEDGKLMIISGERRWRAAKLKNIETLVCIQYVPDKSLSSEKQEAEIKYFELTANIGKPLTDDEIFGTIRDLIDKCGCTVQEVAARTGKSEGWIKSHLSLLKAPVEVLKVVESKHMSPTAAIETARAPEEARKRIVDRAKAGKRIRVADVQKETKGRASLISATHVEKLIKIACDNCKFIASQTDTEDFEYKKWDHAVYTLQCVLGIQEMVDLAKPS